MKVKLGILEVMTYILTGYAFSYGFAWFVVAKLL